MTENEISYIIRGVVFDIYKNIGPGLLESVYEEILFYELKNRGLIVKRQVEISISWKDITLEKAFRADLIIENIVLIEIKSVKEFSKVHYKQIITYLKLTDIKLGLLINFNEIDANKGINRFVNEL